MRLLAGHLLRIWATVALGGAPAVAQTSGAPSEQQSPTPGPTGNPAVPQAQPSPGEPGFAAQLFTPARTNLFGDLYGLRPALGQHGISVGLQNTAELFANVAGGIERGASGDGLAMFSIGVDSQKALGWDGGTFNVSGLGIYGPNFSQGYVGALQTVSGIIAQPTVRLWELWYQQSFAGGGADVKIGLQSIDQEFANSQGSSLFLNTVMGWPAVPSLDLYASGPTYPLSSLGIRLRGQPADGVTVLGGVFQDNPPGGPFNNDSQLLGASRYGANFNFRTGALFIAELQYAINQPPATAAGAPAAVAGLPGTYKLGAWFDTGRFPDQRFDTSGRSLANPASSGTGRLSAHNYSFYAVADQAVWQPGGEDPRVLAVFLRPAVAPTDQNIVDFSVNGGITLKAPLPGRDNDTAGAGFGVANVSPSAGALARDVAFFSGAYVPARGAETFAEVTYQVQIAPWWQVQPDFQYVWMPGGGAANPMAPGKRIGNAAVFGVRTNVTF